MSGPDRDLAEFGAHRPFLVRLAYRMLGDLGRAEDVVQDAWIRWSTRASDAEDARAFLVSVVTRLALNELSSARAQREETRADRLPEPVDLAANGMESAEAHERMSMAFLVALQRLTPAERAVLLLHDVVDYEHAEIARLVDKSEAACRKLLERARAHVASERRLFDADGELHARLLEAFVRATATGDVAALVSLLAEDAILVTDGGGGGRVVAGVRNLPAPLAGAERIAAFVTHVTSRAAAELTVERRILNGEAAVVFRRRGEPFAALLVAVFGGKISRVYFQGDQSRLGHVGEPGDAANVSDLS